MRKSYSFFSFIFALAFVFAFALAVDMAFAFSGVSLPAFALIAVLLIAAAAVFFFRPKPSALWVFFIFALIVIAIILFAIIYSFNSQAGYSDADSGKAEMYGGKNVLVLVPHEDDELIVAAGVIEEYIDYGSEVSLAFVTNGDFGTSGHTRMTEALAVAQSLEIPESNVYFFGYGDRGAAQLYMSQEGNLVPSSAGYSATYGLDSHPAYNDGQEYKRENLVADLTKLLLELRPDIICCTEIEEHIDHSAVSLFLDEAMAGILKSTDDYQPIILKSSCYATAFYAVNDFYATNILATQDPSEGEHYAGIYNWEDRLRLPVDASGLSRSIFGCDTFKQLYLHKSQRVHKQAEGTINGDRVFWLRDTSSLSYDATIETSSGYGKFLNDYKICDSFDLFDSFTHLSSNTWVPEAGDNEKTAHVTLKEKSFIDHICLYDDPDKAKNVLNALITFDDGSSIKTGALNKNGATNIEVGKDNVQSFSVKILETEGEGAGITEIEVYSELRSYGFDFIKLMDMDGNFIYDYFVDEKGAAEFTVFRSGVEGELRVSCDNSRCSVKYDGETITVKCPKDQSCSITVTTVDGKYSDTAVISNPGRFLRETGPYFENQLRQFTQANLQHSNFYRLLRSAYKLVVSE